FVVVFQQLIDPLQLCVDLRHDLLELSNGQRSTDTCHHVFTLGVHQVLAVEDVFAGGRISGEGYACTGGLAHVTKHHGLDVDSCTPFMGNVVDLAVADGPSTVPGTEHGIDG